MHPKDEEGLQRLGRPELLPCPESTSPRRDSRGRLCSVGARSHLPSTSPLPWHCHTAFQGLLGKTERRQGFLVRCHGPVVGIGASSPPWHVPRPLRLPRGAPGAAPRAQPLPCPGCRCEDSAGITSQGTPVAPVTRTGPCVPGQDLAIGLEMALLEIQARRLVSPALGAHVTCPGERWGDEQTWGFPGAEQLWGGSGCRRWPESTVMGLGWHCHRVTPRLVALGAGAAWGWALPCPAAAPGAGPGAGHPPPVARGCSPQGWDHLSLSAGS